MFGAFLLFSFFCFKYGAHINFCDHAFDCFLVYFNAFQGSDAIIFIHGCFIVELALFCLYEFFFDLIKAAGASLIAINEAQDMIAELGLDRAAQFAFFFAWQKRLLQRVRPCDHG